MLQAAKMKNDVIIPEEGREGEGGGGRGSRLNLLPNFQKGGAWQDLNFERGMLEKRG